MDTRLFDVLVGYFRSSGFYQLYESIEPIAKTRILVGIGLDEESYRAVGSYQNQGVLDFDSHSNTKRRFQAILMQEVEDSPETDQNLEKGLRKFIAFLKTDCPNAESDRKNGGNGKKLEIRAFPSRNIHAKVYIGRFAPEDRDYGFVITGSSNFSYAGLVANREFNVELRQRRDVEFAQQQFETLWGDSVDISGEFVDTVENRTWLNDRITPYELYLKLIYEYMQDPRKIVYRFEGELEHTFNTTISLLQSFRYARYIPLLYYVGSKGLSEFEKQQQRNVGGFMKGILIKRLESSFFAFRKSVRRFVESYKRFIRMFESGTVYISKDIDVYDLLDNDDLEALEAHVEAEKAQKYKSEDFKSGLHEDLRHDLETLRDIEALWQTVHEDPKLARFVESLKSDKDLKKKQIVIFTESRETGDYLFDRLRTEFPGEVLFFSSHGGRSEMNGESRSPSVARELIKAAFDPNHKQPTHGLRILITTDVLAEGINLHRANILINYDLPWNPTRVLQRAGRINRLGTKHSDIFIYNFFPTTQADLHLGLEANITNKIQMFHNILGEDAKYLSDGEEIGSQELFDTLNSKKTYTGEDEQGDSELMYLDMMRKIRDEQPGLFEKIKRLPKKARSGRLTHTVEANQLVTFFRIGKLKK